MSSKKALMLGSLGSGASGGGGALNIEDVFSTFLYDGTEAVQSIVNDIDLLGEGGMIWSKVRSGLTASHQIIDTGRGVGNRLQTNGTQANFFFGDTITAFNSDGYDLGADGGNFGYNRIGGKYVSWTFRKAPRFFDQGSFVVGTDANRRIPHDLGVIPGMILLKITNSAGTWYVHHRSLGINDFLQLEGTNAKTTVAGSFGTAVPTTTDFGVGESTLWGAGNTIQWYAFAHDPLGLSGDGSDGMIACGSYVGNGVADGPVVTLGWEPQYVLIKDTTVGLGWTLLDSMRGITTGSNDAYLKPDTSGGEAADFDPIELTPTGFKLSSNNGNTNSAATYIYMAIRRPMKVPEVGTEVYTALARTGTGVSVDLAASHEVDMVFSTSRSNAANRGIWDRLRGAGKHLFTSTTGAEATQISALSNFDRSTGVGVGTDTSLGAINLSPWTFTTHLFKRAPGFLDIVAWSGDGVGGRGVPHGLSVIPEMIITKKRNLARNWSTYHKGIGNTDTIFINLSNASAASSDWNNTDPTSSIFTLSGGNNVNAIGSTYIAYLFATLAGVSKVGSYVGDGSDGRVIDCGFTTGARFILVKAASSTSDWKLWDTARGIVAGNDPYTHMNDASVEGTTLDVVDPEVTGFIVNNHGSVNADGTTYIFLAIA